MISLKLTRASNSFSEYGVVLQRSILLLFFHFFSFIPIDYYKPKMTKRRNHSNHNQNRKHHRNGIKKPKRQRHRTKKGMYLPFAKNLKFVRKGTLKAKMEKKKNQEKEMEVVKN
ncbi:60S ribosomal protein L29 [Anaeramoeba flamelloides]|uniref:60S ribosomal protein L29 n=1 Tax=Anaeramoeba flamelloides TaxID=1746091 RepID=A0ABQ8Y7C6_9EUKA|nr:60S ribosomal protein L29 [Anaeramoeba flamelloides]